VQEGGFLADVGGFDASFFGISPREAKMMDPQQRTFLEVACEALDDAGVPVHGLRGSSTGVFVGIYLNDYAERFTMTTPELIEPYYMTGNTLSGAACRLAYTLGLEGPAMAIDAACASSLVTVHLAARALQTGECDLAIAAGVNLILSPKVSVAACQGHILAPDGRCKAFDQAANGYARSEGCGVVVLKRITDARADHDRVRAVIAGSAVRHGGRTAGFTVPGSQSQQRLLNAALADASVAAGAVDYVEAHGTGTPLGDPVEMRALNAVYGAADSGTACLIGAVKTNLGHLETAAGVAGLIKTVMCLDHGQAPPNLHFRAVNPAITFGESRICLATSLTDLPHRDGGRHAAVSSFGLTGTIAHVVLREGDPPANGPGPAGGHAWLLPLSAKTPEALRTMGGATMALAAGNELAGLCSTAALRRSHYEHRAAVVGGSQASLRAGLAALAEGRSDPALRVGRRRDPIDHGVVFVFSGQGSQWPGMGAELRGRPYEAFEETLAQCDRLIRSHTGWSVLDRLYSPGPGADVTQPLIFAVQVALAALWRSWGIRPDGVIGHSMGEVAAAHVAGALNLADAVHVICLRSRLVRALEGGGGMAVVELPYDEVLGFLGEYGNEVSVAAVNGPSSTVISGLREPLAAAAGALGADGVTVRTVDVDYASHCGLVESVLPELKAGLASIRARVPDISMYSTVTGTLVGSEPLDAAYWQANLRREVRFWPAVEAALEDANDTFVEISPHPILLPGLADDAHRRRGAIVTFPSMRRDHDQRLTVLSALSGLYTLGREPHWPALVDRGRPEPLPPYPWQHADFMLPAEPDGPVPRSGLGEPLRLARHPSTVWPVHLVASRHADVCGHRVAGRPLLPFSVLAGLVAQAGAAPEANGSPEIISLTVERPVTTTPDRPTELQITTSPGEDGRIEVRVDSRVADTWTSCVTASVVSAGPAGRSSGAAESPDLTALRSRPDPTPGEEFYARAAQAGVDYDDPLKVLGEIRLCGDEALATIDPRRKVGRSLGADWTWIEAAVQLAAVLVKVPTDRDQGPVAMPVSLGCLRRLADGAPSSVCTVYARRRAGQDRGHVCDAVILDGDDRPLYELTGLTFEDMGAPRPPAADAPRTWLRQVRWEPAALATPEAGDGAWIVLADRAGVAEHLSSLMAEQGLTCQVIHPERDDHAGHSSARCFPWAHEVTSALDRHGRIEGLIDLTSVGAQEPEHGSIEHVQRSCLRVLESARLVEARGGPGPSPRLWLVTAGAQLDEAEDEVQPAAAALWGLGRALAQERPGLRSLLLDLDPRATPYEMAGQVSRRLADASVRELAVRADEVYSPRLAQVRARPAERPLFGLDGAYLITGGLGDLGLAVARWLAREGARRLLLAGRTPMPPRTSWRHLDADSRDGRRARAIVELEAAGATVETVELDVCDPAAVERFVHQRDEEDRPAIRGVFHLAATLADELTSEVTPEGLAAVLGAKVGGARLLDRHFPDVDHFVLFSSAAALVPLPGQAGYAAANAYLGALARRRRARGQSGLAVHWSVWDGLGFAESRGGGRSAQFLRRAGLPPLPAEGALEALGLLMRMDVAEAAVLRMPEDAHDPALRRSALFAEPAAAAADARTESEIVTRCRDASAQERQELLEEWLQETVGAILGIPADDIDPARPFPEFGMDSLMAVELRAVLERAVGVELPATVAFEHPTARSLAGFLAQELTGPSEDIDTMIGDDRDEELAAVLLAAQSLEDPEQD
jgi:myxalamid-type polyketide synthase MxaE and MxaD